MGTFTLERLSMADISQLIQLSDLMGWDYVEEELNTVLMSGFAFGHKTDDGQLISSAAIFPYSQELASIGMVMVNPNYQRQGLGKSVTEKCIEMVADSKTPIMLIATPKGKLLYEQIGFRSVTTIHKYICNQYVSDGAQVSRNALVAPFKIRPICDDDFYEIVKIDAGAVGAERKNFLFRRIRQAKDGIVLLNTESRTVGYGLCIQNPDLLVLGPIVAPNADLAASIVHHFAQKYEGKLRIDVPSAQEQLRHILERCGFENVSQPPIMLLNANELPKRNNTLFAIAAQAFG